MNKEPILIISVELNLGYRPQIIVYKDSNIDHLVEHFVLEHDLKPSAISIIKQLVMDNMKGKTLGKTHHKNYLEWKSNRQRQKSKENTRTNKPKVLKKQSPRPGLIQMSFAEKSNRGNETLQELSLCDVEKEFEKQFKRIKQERVTSRQQSDLKQIYKKLTQQNPLGVQYITPEFIDFSAFNADFLTILEQFFEILKQKDFQQLDFDKFKRLIEEYHYKDLFKIQNKFS